MDGDGGSGGSANDSQGEVLMHIANCWHKSSQQCPSYFVLYPVDRVNGIMKNVWRLFPLDKAKYVYEFKYNPQFDKTL